MKSKNQLLSMCISMLLPCLCMLCMFSINSKAAATPVNYVVVNNPAEIDANINNDVGMIYHDLSGEYIYSITTTERGWLILDDNYSFYNFHTLKLYGNASLTNEIPYIDYKYYANGHIQPRFYLDPGTYYLYINQSYQTASAFLFFLPNTKVINHNLVKDSSGTKYTDTVSFVPKIGITHIVTQTVAPANIQDYTTWKDATSNATDVYEITANGEYTIKAEFSDTDWKLFPVMYSFSVYDIVPPKDEDGKVDDSISVPKISKLSKGNKAFTIKWNKVSDAEGYQVQYSTSRKFTSAKTKTYKASKSSAKINKLRKNKKYYVRIRCFKTIDGNKVYSEWSNRKSVKTKK
ncbi:fibronectin type III domain-containing protein [Butyrivibrio sp. INlla16]|uniref:fibronectin type III domain-containing protein n=1 Tax=Butyrivibrio sp. INlla16 TaxID=1520807 RepID=UPI0008814F68|nr:fibronectin type III domain-containing protein [Butyrivibrio sp. INlla16]SDB50655.1 Fibronectin type III domain-containing protein [Butyrivibrio sp. INlla16]